MHSRVTPLFLGDKKRCSRVEEDQKKAINRVVGGLFCVCRAWQRLKGAFTPVNPLGRKKDGAGFHRGRQPVTY